MRPPPIYLNAHRLIFIGREDMIEDILLKNDLYISNVPKIYSIFIFEFISFIIKFRLYILNYEFHRIYKLQILYTITGIGNYIFMKLMD